MSIADKLKAKAEEIEANKAKEKEQAKDDLLIMGLLIPVKFTHDGKKVKGFLNLNPAAVYSKKIWVAIDVALEEAGGKLELDSYEPKSDGNGYQKPYQKDWKR